MKLHKRTVKSIAELMIGHYINSMEAPYEFLWDQDEAQHADDLQIEYGDMYGKGLLDFRKDVLKEVGKQMKVKIKIL